MQLNIYIYIFKQLSSFEKNRLHSIAFILLLQTGGLWLVYKAQQYYVRNQMEESLNNKETIFQKLSLSLNDFQKDKINDHEVSINGKMYDIKSISIKKNKVELLAVNDLKEESIIEKINRSLNDGNQQNQELPNHLFKLLTLFYISPATDRNFLFQQKQQNIWQSLYEIIISHEPGISSPPPRLS